MEMIHPSGSIPGNQEQTFIKSIRKGSMSEPDFEELHTTFLASGIPALLDFGYCEEKYGPLLCGLLRVNIYIFMLLFSWFLFKQTFE
jgi:hypothetical protein